MPKFGCGSCNAEHRKSWGQFVKPLLPLIVYMSLISFRPDVPYWGRWVTDVKKLSDSEMANDVMPVGVYSYLPLVLVFGGWTQAVQYKPYFIVGSLAYLISLIIDIWGPPNPTIMIPLYQVGELLYAFMSMSETTLYAYVYFVVEGKSQEEYLLAQSLLQLAGFLSNVVSFVLADVVMWAKAPLVLLWYLALASKLLSLVVATFYLRTPRSLAKKKLERKLARVDDLLQEGRISETRAQEIREILNHSWEKQLKDEDEDLPCMNGISRKKLDDNEMALQEMRQRRMTMQIQRQGSSSSGSVSWIRQFSRSSSSSSSNSNAGNQAVEGMRERAQSQNQVAGIGERSGHCALDNEGSPSFPSSLSESTMPRRDRTSSSPVLQSQEGAPRHDLMLSSSSSICSIGPELPSSLRASSAPPSSSCLTCLRNFQDTVSSFILLMYGFYAASLISVVKSLRRPQFLVLFIFFGVFAAGERLGLRYEVCIHYMLCEIVSLSFCLFLSPSSLCFLSVLSLSFLSLSLSLSLPTSHTGTHSHIHRSHGPLYFHTTCRHSYIKISFRAKATKFHKTLTVVSWLPPRFSLRLVRQSSPSTVFRDGTC